METGAAVVVIGGGLAAARTVEALRDQGHVGPLTLLAAESHLPYERPPLSKAYLMGQAEFADAVVHPAEWYRDHDIDLRLGVRAESVDRAGRHVRLADGTTLPYDKLVLATGAVPRCLPVPGSGADGVLHLRTREDADAIRTHLGPGRRLVVVGAGWIGLEVTAAARSVGTEVTVVETAELPLLGVLGRELAAVFADLHRSHGVDLRLGAQLAGITVTDGRATGVELADGEAIVGDAVVVGVGVTPAVDLAEAAGLAVDNGVLVDAALRTSDPGIWAVGDIANHDHPVLGHRIRVEHWSTALHQPAVAAASLLGGDAEYRDLPYFYSDQYDLGMEYVGHVPRGAEHRIVVRGELATREFVAFWLDPQHRILAAMNVNVWDVVDQVKPLITDRVVVDPARLADPVVPYGELAVSRR